MRGVCNLTKIEEAPKGRSVPPVFTMTILHPLLAFFAPTAELLTATLLKFAEDISLQHITL